MKKYLIYGAGHNGQYLKYMYEKYGEAEILGFIDDDEAKWGKDGVLGGKDDMAKFVEEKGADGVVMAMGYKDLRARAAGFDFVKGLGVEIPSLVHPAAVVEDTVKVGRGVFVGAGTVLDESCVVEDHVWINMNCVIGHNSVIGESCYFSSGINIAGYTKIGKGCFVGMGCTVVDNLEVAGFNVFGAGACVAKPIEDEDGIYVGVPAKLLKRVERS